MGAGFSSEIETNKNAKRTFEPCRCRMGAGFSSEIETAQLGMGISHYRGVAWGLASRLRLKRQARQRTARKPQGRMGAGFSSEIETRSREWS